MIYLPEVVNQFPNTEQALEDPNGLLAMGGDLSIPRLLQAYQQGIFPWYETGTPILWWSPSPRLILYPEKTHCSRSLQKTVRNKGFMVSYDQDFAGVIQHCQTTHQKVSGTWITDDMVQAYIAMHQANHAHSIEIWLDKQLVGGLYGISIGQVFFGESMFSTVTDASKVALLMLSKYLLRWEYQMIDCQVESEHLHQFGTESIPREAFEAKLSAYTGLSPAKQAWITSAKQPCSSI